MSKKFFVVLATSLVLMNGTSAVFATNGSNSDNSSSPTTLPGTRNNNRLTDKQNMNLFQTQLRTYLMKRAEILKTFKNDMANARKRFNIELKSAKTYAARKVARDTFLTAGQIARQNYQNALIDLGAPPTKPGKP